jgi:branched-chain amino acid aminotransferase
MTPINLVVETEYHRAAPGGTGGTKCIGNYSPVLKTQLAAKSVGFSDVLYLDARENKYIEEVSSCNIFVVKGKRISTPALSGTILPGITRKSIIELARLRGYEVQERPVAVDELAEADEVFCTVRLVSPWVPSELALTWHAIQGTAVVVIPVGSITHLGRKTNYSVRPRVCCSVQSH